MAQGLKKSRVAGDPRPRSWRSSKPSRGPTSTARPDSSSRSAIASGAMPNRYSLYMDGAQPPPGLPPNGDSTSEMPMAIRLKQLGQPELPATYAARPGRGLVDNSDSTIESDVNSVFNKDSHDADNSDSSHEQDADEEQLRFVQCPYEGCSETVLADEMAYHVDMHASINFGEKPGDATDADADMPIVDAYADTLTTTASPDEYRDAPSRASSGRYRDEGRRKQRDTPSAQPRRPRENRRAQSADGKHDDVHAVSQPHSHRERRERHRSGRESVSASPQGPQVSKHSASTRKPLPTSSKPWWALWATAPAKKSPAANGKAKEVVAETKSTSASPKRLGKAELGKYANEERMPDKLAVYLKKEWGICHRGMIPVLKELLEQSPTTEYAYLCDPCVQHVSRLPEEGGFCGYRNLQTVISYVIGAQLPGYDSFGHDLPSVFDLQNYIEDAWDKGINTRGRVETGGIRWTRKYIGTPEAVTLFRSLGIAHTVRAFKHKKPERARDLLLRDVEQYFQMGKVKTGHKVRATSLPPIYWQHPGHSLTIVGIEKTTTGETNLLVFDPIFRDGSSIVRIVGRRRLVDYFPDTLLKSYRRGSRYLAKYRAFEIIRLQPKPEDLSLANMGH